MSGAKKELLLPCRGLGVGGYRGGWTGDKKRRDYRKKKKGKRKEKEKG